VTTRFVKMRRPTSLAVLLIQREAAISANNIGFKFPHLKPHTVRLVDGLCPARLRCTFNISWTSRLLGLEEFSGLKA